MKQNSFARLTFSQACPRKGGQGVESAWGCISTRAELTASTWRASASTWGRRNPLLSALPGAQILLWRKSDPTSPLLAAVQSPKLPICKQNVIFIIILKNFRIATVQRAIQLPAFSLILGHRQNRPAMN